MKELLRSYLNVYWLRPETALWRTIDAKALESFSFGGKSVDMACGDGLFTFTLMGGRLSKNFDMFKEVDTKGFYTHKDIYDKHEKNIKPTIIKKPGLKWYAGIDHKQNLLNKAYRLGLYDNIIKHDINDAIKFLDYNSIDTIFSNSYNWIDNIDILLKETAAILKNSGRAILVLPSDKFKDALVYNQGTTLSKIIDRGRFKTYKHCYNFDEWAQMFENCGLKIVSYKEHIPAEVVRFWDYGLRPISPSLIQAMNSLSDKKRIKVKSKWINELMKMFEPVIENIDKQNPTFFIFELKRSKDG